MPHWYLVDMGLGGRNRLDLCSERREEKWSRLGKGGKGRRVVELCSSLPTERCGWRADLMPNAHPRPNTKRLPHTLELSPPLK
jgi:hypothetical protein